MKIAKRHTKTNQHNRRCLSAKGLSLYPLALRPRLFLSKIVATAAIFPLKMPGFGQNSRKIVVLPIILGILSIFGAFFAAGNPVSAASLTLSVPSNLSLDISPSSSGTFVKSNPGQISVSTDNISGYTLVIKAKNNENSENSNALLNGNNKLLSISSNLTEDQYKSAGNLNTWGYLPSKLNGNINTSFLPGPTDEETVIEKTEDANSGSVNEYDLTLAAKVDSSLTAGSYANTFVLSASVNAIPYLPMQNWQGCDSLGDDEIVTLRDERDDSLYRVAKLADGRCWMIDNLKIVNKPITDADSDLQPGASFTIPDSVKSGFTGSDNNAAYYGGTKDASGDDYGAHYSWYTATAGTGTQSMSADGQDAPSSICPKGWRLPKSGANGDFQKLYNSGYNSLSKLTAKPIPGFTHAGYMMGSSLDAQGRGGGYWSSTAYNSSAAYSLDFGPDGPIYPQRDYVKYYGFAVRCIARMKTMQTIDEWGSDVKTGDVVTAEDERDGSTYRVARLDDGKLWMIDNLKIVNKQIASADSDVSSNFTIPSSALSGFTGSNNNAAYYGGTKDSSGDDYGAHYSWYTATAGTGTSSMSSGDATSSICPKGWRLPKGGSSGDFAALDKAMGGDGTNRYDFTARNRFINKPIPGFTYAGVVYLSSLSYQVGNGSYWSSTVYNSSFAYDLNFDADDAINFSPQYYDSKHNGFSVRCIARETMQTVEDWGPNVQEGETVTAVDERDDSTYTVSRLKDGKLWMTQNLRIVNKPITDKDSDLQPGASFTIPANDISKFNRTSSDNHDAAFYANNATNGAYYNWHTATAGTGTYSMSSGNATGSICPKGWRLPTGGSNGEFQQLYNQYNSYSAMTNTSGPHFIIAGYVRSGSLSSVGSFGYYWSSTADGAGYAYYLYFYGSSLDVYPANSYYEYDGLSVRCIVRE